MQFAWGYAPTLIIEAAVHHRLFDLLDRGPRSGDELVRETGASRRGTGAILDALVGLKLLARFGDRYALTAESAAFLVSSRPGYRGGFFQHHVRQVLPQWMHLSQVVRDGRPVKDTNRQKAGAGYFAAFVESLFEVNRAAAETLARHLDLDRIEGQVSVLDIGSGSGVWGLTLAERSARVRVRAVDWPAVIEVTRQVAAKLGVADRLTAAEGDFLEAKFGHGHHVATLGHILHSEGPDRIRRLLKRTLDALAPGGVVAIQEFMPDDDRQGPAHPLIFAVNMLVNTEAGGTYTFAEIRGWLEEAGFVNARLLAVPAVSPVVLADRSGS
jgi:SAM-dependent methyltransferase